MQWIVLSAAFVILLLLVLKARRPSAAQVANDTSGKASNDFGRASSTTAMGRGFLRISLPKSLLSSLESSIAFLCALPSEECLPAANHLRQNARFLQEEAAAVLMEQRNVPKFPSSSHGKTRIYALAQDFLERHDVSATQKELREAVHTWQTKTPLTYDELVFLPFVLRAALLCRIRTLSSICADDHHAQQAARHTLRCEKHGRLRQARRIFQKFRRHPAYLEQLSSLAQAGSWTEQQLKALDHTAQSMRDEQQAHQIDIAQWLENAISSLQLIHRLPWERLSEEWSHVHAIFMDDPVYAAMDAQSRKMYQQRNGQIARMYRTSEETVAKTVLTLCKTAHADSPESHCGFYLIDDGLKQLLARLQPSRASARLSSFVHLQASSLERLFSWLIFCLLITFCWQMRFPVPVWLPFSLFFLLIVQRPVHTLLHRNFSVFLPRMQLHRLTDSTQTLVVCPCVLTSASQAIAMVKKLSILHEATPDQHLHFLLMGDFADNLSATASTDLEIMEAAVSAIQALCDDTRHPFFYLQRERVSEPGNAVWHSRERKRGSLLTVLKLLEGMPVDSSFACATIEPGLLKERYRYVIVLDADAQMPPESMLQLVGSMLHPLAKRQKINHHMRGASIIQPRMETTAHTITTPLGTFLPYVPENGFSGNGIIDPRPFLEAAGQNFPLNLVLGHDLLSGELAGCAYAKDICFYTQKPQNLKALLSALHRRTRSIWQLLPVLFPRQRLLRLHAQSRRRIWHLLFDTLLPVIRLCLSIYALFAGKSWIWAFVMMFPFSSRGPAGHLLRIALLPCEVFVTLDAVCRALYRTFFNHERLLEESSDTPFPATVFKPSLLLFTLTQIFAAGFAALALVPTAFVPGCFITAGLFLLFALTMPFVQQEYPAESKPTSYMREVLLRLARQTHSFFETTVTPQSGFLPPQNLQLDPAKGIAHHVQSADVGLYLCSLVASEKLHLIQPDEMLNRINAALGTLEKLPTWNGLFYQAYDLHTFQPLASPFISAADTGILATSLLTCAQGIRTLLSKLPSSAADIAARLDHLALAMQLEQLFDAEAERFYAGVHPLAECPSEEHCDLLADESRLLSFVSIMLGRIPISHWNKLERSCTRNHALLSQSGSMADYLTPVLFQPLVRGTLLHVSTRSALRIQQRHRLSGAFGISRSGCYAFDNDLNYRNHSFGIPQLALRSDVQSDVLTPYASLLALPIALKKAFRNLLRLEILGLRGPMGLFEAADWNPSRTEGQPMRIVRSHTARHQALILCAICNALEKNHIASLFSTLPRAQAFQFLLEQPFIRLRSPIKRALKNPPESQSFSRQTFERTAHPLHFPIDAHLLSGAGTSWLIDAQGGGRLMRDGMLITQFEESCHVPSGIRLYLRDSQTGAFWIPTDPYLMDSIRFETSEVVFTHKRFEIACELRMWLDPLDGSAIHRIELQNLTSQERVMEACSYLVPAFPTMHSERLGKNGIAASAPPLSTNDVEVRLWHMLQTDSELLLARLQTDHLAFLGRGRSFHAPRALEHAIGAVADSLGDRSDPCMSIRGQFVLPANGKTVLHFITHPARSNEQSAAFTERFATEELLDRSRAAAITRGIVSTRFLHLSVQEQISLSRLAGALLYAGQPFQHPVSSSSAFELQKRFGISKSRPLLLLECSGSINPQLLTQLIKGHALFRENGFPFCLAITIKGKRRLASLTEEIESLFAQCHCEKQDVFIIRQPSDDETAFLHSCARLALEDTTPLEEQLNALQHSVRSEALFSCRCTMANQPVLPEAEGIWMFNGFGGFTPAEGNYRIELAPGMQTPAPWRNPLCCECFGTLADESGLVFSYAADFQNLMRPSCDSVSNRGDEALYLQDVAQRLLWSLTRQPLGHGMPIRVTHAPGETLYESSMHGIFSRMHCFTDAELALGIRIIQLKNEDSSPRHLKLIHSCLFQTSLHCEDDCVCGPTDEGWLWLGAMETCSPSAMSAGAFQGLWNSAPFALTNLEHLPAGEGNACSITLDMQLMPGEIRTFVTAIAYGNSRASVEEMLSLFRTQGASLRLHLLRQQWAKHLSAVQFDLPDHSLSILLNRWLPCQIRNAQLWQKAGFEAQNSSAFPDWLSSLPTHSASFLTSGAEAEMPPDFLSNIDTLTYGSHDLPVTAVDGEEMESVWLGMVLCEAIRRFAPSCDQQDAERLLQRRAALMQAIERHAWDGTWYLYGWDKAGEPVGAKQSKKAGLHLLPQCWSVMCGASRDRCAIAMEAVWQMLYDREMGVIRLLVPLYTEGLPGFAGNGEHSTIAACWAVSALHQLGEDERAWELALRMLPVFQSSSRQLALRYRMEPYLIPASVCTHPYQRGRADTLWHDESAQWYFAVIFHQLLGFRKTGETLRFCPVVPAKWEALRITFRYGSSTYHLHASRQCAAPSADGESLRDGMLIINDDGRIHEAFFPLR